jgi:hypothetical protein
VRQGKVDLARQQELTVVHAGWVHVVSQSRMKVWSPRGKVQVKFNPEDVEDFL